PLKIVEEDSADSAHLPAMFQREIFITPLFEPAIKLPIVPVARLPDRAMKMRRVFGIWIVRREIGSSAKPLGISFLEIAKVRMDGGNDGTTWMKDQRNARSKKFGSTPKRDLCGELLRQFSVNRGEIDSRFLKYTTAFQHARPAAAATLTSPVILAELRA